MKPLPKKSDKPAVEKPVDEKKEEDEEDEQTVKNLRIDFLNSKMAQPYPFYLFSLIHSFP